MGNGHYILVGPLHEVVDKPLLEWARWFEDPRNRRVAETHLEDGTRVSTVFLGLDHRFGLSGPPLVFETMVFDPGGEGGDMERYSSWDDAETGHKAMVRKLTKVKNLTSGSE